VYLQHFQLQEKPFSITPDPRFVYLSESHQNALAHLLYGLGQGGSGGFVVLTGEVGTGKTTLCRLALEQLPEGCEAALILNPQLDPRELLESICQELRIALPPDLARDRIKPLIDALNAHLLQRYQQQKRVVVLIDEAQNLPRDTLEQLRLLTNLETATHKLLQIILLGQPELNALLARDDLRQLAQRITARCHLGALNASDTRRYIAHRLHIAGAREDLFDAAAVQSIFRHTRGIPRVISICADHAMLAAYTEGSARVQARHVRKALQELHPGTRDRWPGLIYFACLTAALLSCALLYLWFSARYKKPPPTPIESAQISRAAATPAPDAQLDLAEQALQNWRAEAGLPANYLLPALALAQSCPERVAADVRCAKGKETGLRLRSLRQAVLLKTDRGYRLSKALQPEQDNLIFEYIALLRLPPDVPLVFSAGYSGPGVARLAQALADFDQGAREQRIFGPRMQERLRRWQAAQGLEADGVVGPLTWLQLSRAPEQPEIPR
jgi:general secretion pathway protein A